MYFWWFWFWMWISSKNYFVRFQWFLWFCLRAPIFHRVGRYIMEVAKYVVFSDVFLYVDYVVLRECLKPSRNKGIFELVLISTTPHLLQSWQHLPHSWQTIHASIKIRYVFRCFCSCWWGRVGLLFKITVKKNVAMLATTAMYVKVTRSKMPLEPV